MVCDSLLAIPDILSFLHVLRQLISFLCVPGQLIILDVLGQQIILIGLCVPGQLITLCVPRQLIILGVPGQLITLGVPGQLITLGVLGHSISLNVLGQLFVELDFLLQADNISSESFPLVGEVGGCCWGVGWGVVGGGV